MYLYSFEFKNVIAAIVKFPFMVLLRKTHKTYLYTIGKYTIKNNIKNGSKTLLIRFDNLYLS